MSKIGIKLEGDTEYLELSNETSIELNIQNPLLGDDVRISPGAYTIPFKIPGGDASPLNSRKLNNPDVIENISAVKKKAVYLDFDHIPWKKGSIKFRSISGSQMEAALFFGLSQVAPDIKKAKMRDVLSETILISATGVEKSVQAKPKDGGDYKLEVNGKVYEGGYFAISAAINIDAELQANTEIFVPFSSVVVSGPDAPYINIRMAKVYNDFVTPPAYSTDPLIHLTVKIPEGEPVDSYTITGSLPNYFEGFDTFLDGYITGSYPTDKIRFPAMFNPNLHNGELIKYSDVINLVNSDGIVRNNPSEERNRNSLQPYLKLKYALDAIAQYFGIELDGDFYNSSRVNSILLDNSVALDVPMEFINGRKFIFWRRSFQLAELVPDLKVTDFLRLICLRYNVGMYYDDRSTKVVMKMREPIARSKEYEDITPICSPILNLLDDSIDAKPIEIPKDDTDLLSQNESFGTSEFSSELECGRLHATGQLVDGSMVTNGPKVSRKINDKFSLRVFHYIGLVSNGVNNYPAAAIETEDFKESLSDLYFDFHQYWSSFGLSRMNVSLQVDWPFRDLINFDWSLKRMFNRSLYLVRSMKIRIEHERVRVIGVELITMINKKLT